jgi:mannose-6-phosphate isomerase-like protein (cupin superfamily)
MAVWIVLTGAGALLREQYRCGFRGGDVLLIPAKRAGTSLKTTTPTELLEVTIPPQRG